MNSVTDTWNDIGVVIGVLGAIAAFIFGFLAYRANKSKADTRNGERDGMIMNELGNIKGGIEDIKREQCNQREKREQDIKSMALIEASVKSAHHRIDELKDVIANQKGA